MKSQGLSGGGDGVPLFLANFPNGLLNDFRLPRRPLMLRAALMRRSCDGVAAATESLLRRRCADQLRRAHPARRVSTRRAEWGASIIPAGGFKFQFVAHSPSS